MDELSPFARRLLARIERGERRRRCARGVALCVAIAIACGAAGYAALLTFRSHQRAERTAVVRPMFERLLSVPAAIAAGPADLAGIADSLDCVLDLPESGALQLHSDGGQVPDADPRLRGFVVLASEVLFRLERGGRCTAGDGAALDQLAAAESAVPPELRRRALRAGLLLRSPRSRALWQSAVAAAPMDVETVRTGLLVLGGSSEDEDVLATIRGLAEESPDLHALALEPLARSGDESALRRLLEIAISAEPAATDRTTALNSLAALAAEGAIPAPAQFLRPLAAAIGDQIAAAAPGGTKEAFDLEFALDDLAISGALLDPEHRERVAGLLDVAGAPLDQPLREEIRLSAAAALYASNPRDALGRRARALLLGEAADARTGGLDHFPLRAAHALARVGHDADLAALRAIAAGLADARDRSTMLGIVRTREDRRPPEPLD